MQTFFCRSHGTYHSRAEIQRRILTTPGLTWCCRRGCLDLKSGEDINEGEGICTRPHLLGCCLHWDPDPGCAYTYLTDNLQRIPQNHSCTIVPGGVMVLTQDHELQRIPKPGNKRHRYWPSLENPTPRIRHCLNQNDDLKALLLNPEFTDCQLCYRYWQTNAIGALRKHIMSSHIPCAYGSHDSAFHEHGIGFYRRYMRVTRSQVCCMHGYFHSTDGLSTGLCHRLRRCCACHKESTDHICSLYSYRMSRKCPL